MGLLADLRARLNDRRKTGVVFTHTPKCGGSSVEAALHRHYRFSHERILPVETWKAVNKFHPGADAATLTAEAYALRKRIMAYYLECGVQCITGHNPLDPQLRKAFAGSHKFITVLRDPVERFCSNYRYNYNAGYYAQIKENIDDFLKTPRAIKFGTAYVAYFSGLDIREDLTTQTAIDRAQKSLAGFDVVGFLDRMPDFETALEDAIGARVKIGHLNKISDRPNAWRGDFTDRQVAAIREVCRPDIEIYEFIRNHCGF